MVQKKEERPMILSTSTETDSLIPKHLSRHEQLLHGYLEVSDLDKDELRLCRIKEGGKMPRGRPRILPDSIKTKIQRELHKRLFDEINKHAFDAVDTIVDVMHQGEGASAFQGQKDGTKRFEAAKYLLERVVGKVPDKTENTSTVTVWQENLESGGLFVDVDAEEIHNDTPRELEAGTRAEKPQSTVRKAGPRTRPRKKTVDGS